MSRIIKIKEGDKVPDGGKFLYAKTVEENHRVVSERWKPSLEELFSLGTQYKVQREIRCDRVTYFYYEVS